ncbi:hypothetical protein FRC11_004564, partial [Ceratobasidium sp. 423]
MLQYSKTALSCARNTSAFAPVHKLPPEVLGYIFRLVVAGEPCFEERRNGVVYSKYPGRLARVCSSWRRIATGLSDLWVHIDLSPHHFYNHGFLPRAEAYVARSGQLPLYVHVHGSEGLESWSLRDFRSTTFLASIVARIRTLDLDMNLKFAYIYGRILEECFRGCTPGLFSRLIIRRACSSTTSPRFLVSNEEKRNEADSIIATSIKVPEQRLADVLLRCTSFYLDGLFFPWTSRAYQGLVELRLTCPEQAVEIPTSQLTAILGSSPQLRILDFRIYIMDEDDSRSPPIEPVILAELESLTAGPEESEDFVAFLRLIAPGPKPLEVAFHFPYGEDILRPGLEGYIREFFSRSNVRRLSVSGMESCAGVPRLLQLAPNVRELVLEPGSWREEYKQKLAAPDRDLSLNTLYLFDSVYFWNLLDLLQVVKVHTLIGWDFSVVLSEDQSFGIFDEKPLREWFLELCSEVKLLDGDEDPNPIPSR